MEETFSRIISDFLEIHQNPNTHSHSALISRSTLVDLQFLFSTGDPELQSQFYDDLASKNLSLSSITHLLASMMDSAPTHVALLASKVYLSLLLSPNSAAFTLTPVAFPPFLHFIRRSLEHRPPAPPDESSPSPQAPNTS
ncbi:hypothetical protein SLE2022_253010 [Rubroshorea leprosula]